MDDPNKVEEEVVKTEEGNEKDTTPKTYTEEDLQKAKDEAATAAALAAETKVREEENKKAIEKEEAAKLAAMDEKEREKAILEKREKDLSAKEAEIARREAKTVAATLLSQNGLPTEIADLVVGSTEDITKANITTLKTSFDKAVEVAVSERLKGKAPVEGNSKLSVDQDTASDEEFFKNYRNKK